MSTHNRAQIQLSIDGDDAELKLEEEILQAIVEESSHCPSMLTLILRNDYKPGSEDDQSWKFGNLFQIGKSIKLGFSPSTAEANGIGQGKAGEIFQGEITAIETNFTEKTQAPLIIRGMDVSHRLLRGRHNRSFQNMTDSDIVRKIATEIGITLGTIEESGVPHEYLFQNNQSNMNFLQERASRIGFELFVQDEKLHFHKPQAEKKISLKWLRDIHSFRTRASTSEQVKSVEVRAWDYNTKRSIVAKAESEQVITHTENGRGSESIAAFGGSAAESHLVVVDQPVSQPKEADMMAQAICDELGGQFVWADAKAEGNADIRPGRVIELQELGPHSGQYYVTETRHFYSERVYTTEFSVRGSRSGDLFSSMVPSPQSKLGQTFLAGIVTDNKDPKGMGRVKVKFPTLTENHGSNWARVVAIGAGNGRGFDCLPEIDDEVLVGFEHGDIHRPYILGGVWNGQDPTPTPVESSVQEGQVCLRTFKTRAGHQLQFDDGSNSGAVLKTANGYELRLSDSDGSVELNSPSGSFIRIGNDGTLRIHSTTTIQMSAGVAINMKSPMITSSTPILPGL